MEDDTEDGNKNKSVNHQNLQKKDQDDIFKPDLTNPKYSCIHERINRIFDSDYLNFIRKIEDPLIKEIYVLLRKYQYYFTKLHLNNTILFDFTKSSDCILNNLASHYEQEFENFFTIEINILPKFKKNEINFIIPEDVLDCVFYIYFYKSEHGVEIPDRTGVVIRNLKDFQGYHFLSDLMSNLLTSFVQSFPDNFIIGVNKFITYIENYFPEVHKKAFEKYLLNKDVWSQDEQNQLEDALLKFSSVKNAKDKFNKIAEYIKTKTLAECVKRYKKLSAGAGTNKNKTEEIKQIKPSLIVVKPEPVQEEPKIKLSINKPIAKPIKEVKILVNKITPLEVTPLDTLPKKVITTSNLVDDIINQFNTLYGDIKFGDPETESKDQALICNLREGQENEDDFEDEEDDSTLDEVDEMHLKNERKNRNPNSNKNKNNNDNDKDKEEADLDKSLISISSKNLELVNTIFKMGEKSFLNLGGVVMNKIALAEICEPSFFFKCSKCKKIGFESHFIKFNKKSNIFYMGVICPRCNNEMHIIFKSELLHPENLTVAGYLFTTGVTIVDFLPCSYMINCLKCTDTYKKVKLRIGGLANTEKNCRSCNEELLFYIYTGNISPAVYTDFSFLDNFEIYNFQKFNHNIDNDDLSNYVKKFEKTVQVGMPLPDKGACKHYKLSYRWFRFGCCSKIYPCDVCHDDVSSHEAEYARTILCGHCAFEQTSQNKLCSKCGNSFFRVESGRGFWEGGKGCRNKAQMSNKDGHKFKNSDMKTISRKKREEIKEKK